MEVNTGMERVYSPWRRIESEWRHTEARARVNNRRRGPPFPPPLRFCTPVCASIGAPMYKGHGSGATPRETKRKNGKIKEKKIIAEKRFGRNEINKKIPSPRAKHAWTVPAKDPHIHVYIYIIYAREKFLCVCAHSTERIKRLYGNSLTARPSVAFPAIAPTPSKCNGCYWSVWDSLAPPPPPPSTVYTHSPHRPNTLPSPPISPPPPLSPLNVLPPLNRLFPTNGVETIRPRRQ